LNRKNAGGIQGEAGGLGLVRRERKGKVSSNVCEAKSTRGRDRKEPQESTWKTACRNGTKKGVLKDGTESGEYTKPVPPANQRTGAGRAYDFAQKGGRTSSTVPTTIERKKRPHKTPCWRAKGENNNASAEGKGGEKKKGSRYRYVWSGKPEKDIKNRKKKVTKREKIQNGRETYQADSGKNGGHPLTGCEVVKKKRLKEPWKGLKRTTVDVIKTEKKKAKKGLMWTVGGPNTEKKKARSGRKGKFAGREIVNKADRNWVNKLLNGGEEMLAGV